MNGFIAKCPTKLKPVSAFGERISTNLMANSESQSNDKVYFHYNHTIPSKFSRWTARESYEFMGDRPWQQVHDIYSSIVNGSLTLLELFGKDTCVVHDDAEIPKASDRTESENESENVRAEKSGRWARVTFKIVLSYNGDSFDGWQKQPGLNTVQGIVEKSLGRFVDEKKAQLLKDQCKPLEGCTIVAGRTDKGVSALQQVCSFYTWRTDIKPSDIENCLNHAAVGKLRVVSISKVSRVFHPNFTAKWRHYMYIFPLNDGENDGQSCESEVYNVDAKKILSEQKNRYDEHVGEEHYDDLTINDQNDLEDENKSKTFSITKVNQLLQQLEGKLLSYKMFARDTKASRNFGPPTECFIYHARAAEVRLPCSGSEGGREVMCVELVANRFLRKMVRVLVATSVREAAAVAEDDALLRLMDATSRRATAPPAPPDGLCLVDVGYTEFDPKICLIP